MRGYGRAKTNKGTMVVMFSVMALLVVFIANIAPAGRVALFFLSSVFVMGIMMERMFISAFISFFAVCFAGFILAPDKSGMVPYLVFFGHYGIFKYAVEASARGATAMTLKLVYYNVCMAVLYFFGGGYMLAPLPEMPWWLLIILAEAVFLIYDFLFTRLSGWYYSNIRGKLIGSRI
jgi:hypothetical protein